MYEVEVKVPADLDRVRERLEAAGASAEGATTQVDVYYDHPVRSFAATDEALRLRRSDAGATLTYKGPRTDDAAKTRREVETAVDDPGATAALLEAVGFAPAAEVRKERERYDLDGYAVVLDRVEGLGTYVEVEAVGDEAEVQALQEGAEARLERLGLDPDDAVADAYLELLEDARE